MSTLLLLPQQEKWKAPCLPLRRPRQRPQTVSQGLRLRNEAGQTGRAQSPSWGLASEVAWLHVEKTFAGRSRPACEQRAPPRNLPEFPAGPSAWDRRGGWTASLSFHPWRRLAGLRDSPFQAVPIELDVRGDCQALVGARRARTCGAGQWARLSHFTAHFLYFNIQADRLTLQSHLTPNTPPAPPPACSPPHPCAGLPRHALALVAASHPPGCHLAQSQTVRAG